MISRRAFLQGSAAIASTAALAGLMPKWAGAATHPYLITSKGRKKQTSLVAISLLSGGAITVPLGFEPHSFLQHPRHPNRIWAIEKWGANAAEIDLHEGQVRKVLRCPSNKQFYGHGLFAADGTTLFIVRVDLTKGIGHLVGFDTATYQQVEDYQVTVGGLHDSQLLPDGTMLVTSSGLYEYHDDDKHDFKRIEDSSLVHIDLQSGKKLEQKFIHDDARVIGHFAQTAGGGIIALTSIADEAISEKDFGHIYLGNVQSNKLRKLDIDPATGPYKGEMLSVAANDDGTMAMITNPNGRKMVVIDPKNGTYITTLMMAGTAGVCYYKPARQFISSAPSGVYSIEEHSDPNFKMRRLSPQVCTNVHNLLVYV
jgi:hypothetical protein